MNDSEDSNFKYNKANIELRRSRCLELLSKGHSLSRQTDLRIWSGPDDRCSPASQGRG